MSESFQQWAGKLSLTFVPAFVSVVITSYVGIKLIEYRIENISIETERMQARIEIIDERSRKNNSLHQVQDSVNTNFMNALDRRDRENDEEHNRLWGAIESLRGQSNKQRH